MLRNPSAVVPVLNELRRRLRPKNGNGDDDEVGEESSVLHDVEMGKEDGITYLFVFSYLLTVVYLLYLYYESIINCLPCMNKLDVWPLTSSNRIFIYPNKMCCKLQTIHLSFWHSM